MALKTFVKLNSISNLTDARYGAGMYVNLLGFDLNRGSENFISPETFKEITGWVSGVDLVGQFTYKSEPDILQVLREYPGITWVEFDRIDGLKVLAGSGYNLIYKIPLLEIRHIELEVADGMANAEIILHVTSDQQPLSLEDLETLAILSKNCKVILGSGITKDNILDLIENTGIYGISLSGGEETKPGLKDLNELADILEKLEIEE
ncbi:hypothetical protein GCM10009119_01010 [Algoriphagus jejuensis]|uniref:phosphoribosylanthranilate isomerase n=1 Tax=Algoriphagus jejuensis TaxID=419934 RepID=A0ABN1MVG2_9BACT